MEMEPLTYKEAEKCRILQNHCRIDNESFPDHYESLKSEMGLISLERILSAINARQQTFLDILICANHQIDIVLILKRLVSDLGVDFVKQLLSIKNQWNSTILHFLSHVNSTDTVEKLVTFIIDEFDKTFSYKLLTRKDKNGNIFLHYFAQSVKSRQL